MVWLIEALCYNTESWSQLKFFNLLNPFSRITAVRLTQPLTKISIKNLSGRKAQPACKVL